MRDISLLTTAATALLLLGTAGAHQSKFELFKMHHAGKREFVQQDFELNKEPVIGIVSQTLEHEMKNDTRFDEYNSYIMQAYVEWVEASGARVVPLINGDDIEETKKKLKKMSGVLFPGGDGSYHDYGKVIFDYVKEINDNGTYMPIWGTCAGQHELLAYVSDAGWDVLDIYDMDSASLTLDFPYGDPTSFPMFAGLGPKANLFKEYNVTYNSHHWSLHPDKFKTDKGLGQWFKPTSLSYMPAPDSRPFVASMETTGANAHYPFYGTQYHPEKAAYIYNEGQAVNHKWVSILLNQHFSEFFMQEARRNPQTYGNYSMTQKDII